MWLPFLLAVIAYLPTLLGGFVWDDVSFIVKNPAAHEVTDLGTTLTRGYGWVPSGEVQADAYLYFRPVIVVANTVQWVLSGGKPWLFHLANLLTHGLCAALLSSLALLMGLSAGAALLAGGIFALHPIHSEAVAWISGRTDLSAALFALLALVFLVAWRTARWPRLGRWLPWLAAVALLLALASKESAGALLVIAPVLIYLPSLGETASIVRPGRSVAKGALSGAAPSGDTARRFHPTAALRALGAAAVLYLVLRLLVLGSGVAGGDGILDGAEDLQGRGPLLARVILGGNLLLVYLLRLCVPWPLSMEPPHALTEPPYPLAAGIFGSLLLAAMALLWIRFLIGALRPGALAAGRARVRSVAAIRSPAALAGLGLFLLAIFPVLQWIPTGEVYGERFLYLPAAGLALLGAALLDRWLRRNRAGGWILLGVLAVPCLVLLQMRLPDWKDEVSLFRSAVHAHPESARAHGNLGSALVKAECLAEAEAHLERAISLDPQDARMQAQYGSLLVNLGRIDEGVEKLEWAYGRITPTTTLLKNLGIGWTHQGRCDEAAEVLGKAVLLDPADSSLLDALATAQRRRGRLEEADGLFQRAIELDPERKSYYLNLIGLHYFDRRDWDAARHWGQLFLSRFPDAPEAARTRQLLKRDPGTFAPADK